MVSFAMSDCGSLMRVGCKIVILGGAVVRTLRHEFLLFDELDAVFARERSVCIVRLPIC